MELRITGITQLPRHGLDFKIAMADLSIISGTGRLRGRDLVAIQRWGQKHRDALYSNGKLAREGKPLIDIED
jgi:hypothetical protein